MNDLVHDSLRDVAEHVSPPPFDRTAFQRRVRAVRRRQRTTRVALAAAAVAAVGGTTLAVRPLLEGGGGDAQGFISERGSAAAEEAATTAWFVQGGTLRHLDHTGSVLDSGAAAEEVLRTEGEEGTWYVDEESRIRWMAAVSDGEGGSPTLTPGEAPAGVAANPVRGSVQGAEVSADGRYLAWVTLDEELLVHDFRADEDWAERRQLRSGDRLLGVSAAGALVERDGDLYVLGPTGATDVRLPRSDVAGASISGTTVAVRSHPRVGSRAATRVFDVASGAPVLMHDLDGWAWPSPYGDRFLVLPAWEEAAEPLLVVTVDGRTTLAGVEGRPTTFGFAGEDRVLLATGGGGSSRLHDCELATGECMERLAGPEVRLSDLAR